MADDTRSKSADESLRKTKLQLQQLQKFTAATHESLAEVIQRQEDHQRILEEIRRSTDEFRAQVEQMPAKTDQKIELLTEWIKNQTPRGN